MIGLLQFNKLKMTIVLTVVQWIVPIEWKLALIDIPNTEILARRIRSAVMLYIGRHKIPFVAPENVLVDVDVGHDCAYINFMDFDQVFLDYCNNKLMERW